MSDVTQRIERIQFGNDIQAPSKGDIKWLCHYALVMEKVIAFRKSGTIYTHDELEAWNELSQQLEAARRDPA